MQSELVALHVLLETLARVLEEDGVPLRQLIAHFGIHLEVVRARVVRGERAVVARPLDHNFQVVLLLGRDAKET